MIFDKNKKLKILIVSAHPDDEVLGCGATIAKHVSLNHKVYSLNLTDGTKARDKNYQKPRMVAKMRVGNPINRKATPKSTMLWR